jgi:hypothetical protein
MTVPHNYKQKEVLARMATLSLPIFTLRKQQWLFRLGKPL